MGPRMFIRGNLGSAGGEMFKVLGFNGAADVHPRKPPWPKCGPVTHRIRFNGAADVHPRKRKHQVVMKPAQMLQWGRGCSSAETGAGVEGPPHRFQASMGPRMFIRGNFPGIPVCEAPVGASMGPRMFIRGNASNGELYPAED